MSKQKTDLKPTFKLPKNLNSASRESWQRLAEKALGGRSLTALNSITYDGITIKPLYDKADIEGKSSNPLLRQQSAKNTPGWRPWEMIQLVDIPNQKQANQQIIKDLSGGATGLLLSISADIPYASGILPLEDQQALNALFKDVDLNGTSLYLTNGSEGLSVAAALINYLTKCEYNLSQIKGNFGFDPLSQFASLGAYPDPSEDALNNWIDAAHALKDMGSAMKPFQAFGRTWQQAGASEAMELAFTLASALYYIRALTDAGFTNEQAFEAVDISLVATNDIFLTIAKFRAMRMLWQKIATASNQVSSMKLTAEMSYLHLTERDPEVNMLRATAATVAAGLGNVDALVLLPFSSANGLATSAARRLCLNTQIIAQEESHIGQVEDPTAGAWYVESLTQELAAKAWDMFRQTEQAGGMPKMLRSGKIMQLIEPIRAAKEQDIATGQKAITGITIFPTIEENPPPTLDESLEELDSEEINQTEASINPIHLPTANKGDRFKEICALLQKGTSLPVIEMSLEGPSSLINMLGDLQYRLVASFEGLRQLSDNIASETGQRPSVFLANLGRPSDYTARVTWAKSYFEAGGIKAINNDGLKNHNELINAFAQSSTKIACLCSSDDIYLEEATKVAKALTQAGARAVYMVARPELLKSIPQAEHQQIHALLYKGTNQVLTLMEAHYLIGFEDEPVMV